MLSSHGQPSQKIRSIVDREHKGPGLLIEILWRLSKKKLCDQKLFDRQEKMFGSVKCAVLGDGAVGKTCFLIRFPVQLWSLLTFFSGKWVKVKNWIHKETYHPDWEFFQTSDLGTQQATGMGFTPQRWSTVMLPAWW